MKRRVCSQCNQSAPRRARYCARCGSSAIVDLTIPRRNTTSHSHASRTDGITVGGVLSMIPAIVQILGLLIILIMLLITIGPRFGMFDMDDIFFKFLQNLASGSTPYRAFISQMRWIAFGALVVLGMPLFFIIKAILPNTGKEGGIGHVIACVCFQFFSLTSFMFLVLYDFYGFARGFLIVTAFISLLLQGVCMIISCIKTGGAAFFIQLLAIVISFFIAVWIVPLFGACLVIFGDLFWIVIMGTLLAGESSTVFVWVRIL